MSPPGLASPSPCNPSQQLAPERAPDVGLRALVLRPASGAVPRYYCERSRYTLVAPALDGVRRLIHAPCKSNRCPYCGRVNMYRKRNRLYARIEQDRETGLAQETAYEFVTSTVRPGAMTEEQAYKWIKPAMSYAIRQVRRARCYNKRYRRASWSGCELEYVNDVDVQPNTKMPHVHALYCVRFPGVKRRKGVEDLRRRYSRRMAKELHYYANNWLRKRLGLTTARWREGDAYPYQGEASILYVHFSAARSTENCLMYMALHNGKVWTDGRDYPRNYRRFATSRAFLLKEPEKEPSGYEFVKQRLYGVCQKLVGQGVAVAWSPADLGHDGNVLAVTISDLDGEVHCWETAAGVQRQVETGGNYRLDYALGRAPVQRDPTSDLIGPQLAADVQEKMDMLHDFWQSDAHQEGLTFDAWRAGAVAPSLEALAPPVQPVAPVLSEQDLVRDLQAVTVGLDDAAALQWVRSVAKIRRRQKEQAAKKGRP